MKFKQYFLLLTVFILVAFSTYFFGPMLQKNYFEKYSQSQNSQTDSNTQNNSGKKTQIEFQELTIPYLRSRSYSSQLSTLEELERINEYTSYITTYDSDGLQINGLLTIPNTQQPEEGFPAVVFVHGYIPPQQYSTTDNYEAYVDYLAKRGLVVFKIDLRGHGNSQGTASGTYFSGDYIIDVLNAYNALENANFVDSNSIGLWGHSMAGNVVLRSAAAKQTIPKVVLWAGAVFTYEDFYELRINDSSYQRPSENSQRSKQRDNLFATHGEFDPVSEFWSQVPATNFLEGVTTEFQIHHAENDNVVDIKYSTGLVDIFEMENIPHEFFRYESGGHNISGSAFSTAMQSVANFFQSEYSY